MPVRQPSPALVIALVALFVSLGDVSYGLVAGSIGSRELKDGGVRSRDIRNEDIRGRDIRRGAVGSGDVRDRSLRAVDFAASFLPGRRGLRAATELPGRSVRGGRPVRTGLRVRRAPSRARPRAAI
jgi:hypothetical protein